MRGLISDDTREALGILGLLVGAVLLVAAVVGWVVSFFVPSEALWVALLVVTAPVFALVVDLVFGFIGESYDRLRGDHQGEVFVGRWLVTVVLVAAAAWVVGGVILAAKPE